MSDKAQTAGGAEFQAVYIVYNFRRTLKYKILIVQRVQLELEEWWAGV